jgi:LytS/YehU family sensor histidine kinase
MAGLPIRLILGPGYHYWNSFRASLQIALVLSVLITIFSVVYANFKSKLETTQLQLTEKEVEREKALKLATEATLSSLESRMHPHFLFNTINSISSLIQEDPARAEKMLSQMADLLRFSLDSARTGLVPLSRELKIVHDYLEIEKARFESRLRYDIQIPCEFDDVPFPPLSLQTLVENSVKYAVSVTRTGADISIRGYRDGSQVIISVEDNGPGFDPADIPAGHGLSSLTARLESLYQGAAQIKIGSRGGHTVVALQIPA